MNIKETIQLLGIQEVTTPRQKKNGTVVWKLPIKRWGKFIEVASFKSGYVRNNNCGYSNYQLNKRTHDISSSKFGKTCWLIPDEQDRLEYLIRYCLKNYYIKQANMIEDGKFVPKWKYEHDLETMERVTSKIGWRYGNEDEISVTINGHRYKVK